MSKEIKVPCQTYTIARQCECGGEMKYESDGSMTMVLSTSIYPQMYKCGKTETFSMIYPRPMSTYDMPETAPVATITNRDHLRDVVNNLLERNFSSSLKDDCKDESIAEVFGNLGSCDVCPLDNNLIRKCMGFDCEENILEYLQKYGDEPYVQ